MKLGFLTGYSRERIEFARREGFDCVSLVDGGPGAEFDVVSIAEDKIKEIREIADRNHIAITAVAYYTHHIEEAQIQRFRSTIQVAAKLGAKVAATFAGGAPNLKPEENFPRFKEVFSEYTRWQRTWGLKLRWRTVLVWLAILKISPSTPCGGRGSSTPSHPKRWDSNSIRPIL